MPSLTSAPAPPPGLAPSLNGSAASRLPISRALLVTYGSSSTRCRRLHVDAVQIAEQRRPAFVGAPDGRPEHLFVERRDPAAHVEAPDLRRALVEAQLRERDPQLRGPAPLVHRRLCLPDRVERVVVVEVVVAGVVVVQARAAGGHAEGRSRAPVEIGVERHQEVLGLLDVVAAAERRLDRRARRHSRADIQRAVVVDEAHVQAVGGRGALDRLLLREPGERRRLSATRPRRGGHPSEPRLREHAWPWRASVRDPAPPPQRRSARPTRW